MDRFIAVAMAAVAGWVLYLKSNMDRFIVITGRVYTYASSLI